MDALLSREALCVGVASINVPCFSNAIAAYTNEAVAFYVNRVNEHTVYIEKDRLQVPRNRLIRTHNPLRIARKVAWWR